MATLHATVVQVAPLAHPAHRRSRLERRVRIWVGSFRRALGVPRLSHRRRGWRRAA